MKRGTKKDPGCKLCGKVYSAEDFYTYEHRRCKDCERDRKSRQRVRVTRVQKYGADHDSFIDLTGKKFGDLTALRLDPSRKDPLHWFCFCSCGVEKSISGISLRHGRSRSCGCGVTIRRRRENVPQEKPCTDCGVIKQLEEFYRDSKLADGRFHKCKSCCGIYARENRNYDRTAQRRSLARSKFMAKTGQAVFRAVRDGLLVRKPCEECGKDKVHAHHCDYARPFDVTWLCPEHHLAWHRKNGPGLGLPD